MAEQTTMRNNALPYPVYGCAWTVVFPMLDADGDLVTGATTPDAEVSLNGGTFSDCTNESTEIATNSGVYYLTLTAAEMTADIVAVIAKSATAGMKTTTLVLYPRKLVTLSTGTCQGSNDTGDIQLASADSAIDDIYNGCLVVAVIDGTTEARLINDYVGSTRVAEINPAWNTAQPDSNDTYTIYLPEGRQIAGADVKAWLGTTTTAATAGIPDVGVKNINNVSTSAVTTIKAVQGIAVDGVITTVTNQLTAAQIATGVWQDATGSDFTAASSIGKSLYTSGVAPGGSGGILISGSNSGTTTLGALTVTGATTLAALSCTTLTASGAVAFQSTFIVTGAVTFSSTFATTGTTTFNAFTVTNAMTVSGTTTHTGAVSFGSTFGVTGTTTLAALTTTGTMTVNAFTCTNNFTVSGNWLTTGTTTWTGAAAFSNGLTSNITGTLSTVTTLTNLPAITANWLTATGIAADAITAAKIADAAIDTATFATGTTIPRCTLVDTTTTNTDMLTAAQVNAECDTALADYDGPTHAEMTTEHAALDVDILTRLPTSSYTAPDNTKTGFKLASDGLDSITVESGMNFRQAQSVIACAAAGVLAGAATTTITIAAANDALTNRITATVDADGNRSAVTLTLPT